MRKTRGSPIYYQTVSHETPIFGYVEHAYDVSVNIPRSVRRELILQCGDVAPRTLFPPGNF